MGCCGILKDIINVYCGILRDIIEGYGRIWKDIEGYGGVFQVATVWM